MAYRNLLNQSCTDKAEFFCRMRDFICARNGTYDYSSTGIGWTLHDSSYAVDEDNPQIDDWVVIKSVGESGKDQIYLKLTWKSGYIATWLFLYWDNSTHTGTTSFDTIDKSCFVLAESGTSTLKLAGDLDFVFMMDLAQTNLYATQWGKLEASITTEDIGISTGTTLSAGSDVSIIVDITIPADWVVGNSLFIFDQTGMEKIEIKTINTGTKTLTADLTRSYSGSLIHLTRHMGYYHMGNNRGIFSGQTTFLLTPSGSSNVYVAPVSLSTTAGFYPELMDGAYGLFPIVHNSATYGVCGTFRHLKAAFISGSLAENDVAEEIDGTEWRVLKCYSNSYFALKEV